MRRGGLRPAGNLARAQARIGIVFNLFEHLTALENLMEASIRVYRQSPKTARAIGLQLLAGVRSLDKSTTCRTASPAVGSSGRDRERTPYPAAADAVRQVDIGT